MRKNELSEVDLSRLYTAMSIPSLEPSSEQRETIIVDANCLNLSGNQDDIKCAQKTIQLLAGLQGKQGFQIIVATNDITAFKEKLASIAIVSPDGTINLEGKNTLINDVRHWDGLGVNFAHAIITDELPQSQGFLTPNHFLMMSSDDVLKHDVRSIVAQISSVFHTAQDRQISGTFTVSEDAYETWDAITELEEFSNMRGYFRIAENNMYFQQTTSDDRPAPDMIHPGGLAEEALYQYFLAYNHKQVKSSSDADTSLIACNKTLNRIVEYYPLEGQSQFGKAFSDVKLIIEEYAECYAQNLRHILPSRSNPPPIPPPDAEPC